LQETVRLNEELRRLYSEKKYEEALAVAEKVLTIREKALGKDHPLVANALSNLALVYSGKDSTRPEQLYLRALEILERTFGKEHPNLLPPLKALATIYQMKWEFTKEEKIYERVLAIQEKALSREHLLNADILDFLGFNSRNLGNGEKAESFF